MEILSSFTPAIIVSIISAIIAASGLFYTAINFKNSTKVKQMEVADKIIRDLLDLEKELSEIRNGKPKEPEQASFDNKDDYSNKIKEYRIELENNRYKFETWKSIYFNKLEWMSFLIIEKQIKDKKIIEYFESGFMESYEKIFTKAIKEYERKKQYTYIEKLYEKYKSNKKNRRFLVII